MSANNWLEIREQTLKALKIWVSKESLLLDNDIIALFFRWNQLSDELLNKKVFTRLSVKAGEALVRACDASDRQKRLSDWRKRHLIKECLSE